MNYNGNGNPGYREKLEKVMREEEEKRRKIEFNKEIDSTLELYENARKRRSVTKKIELANTLPTQEYKEKVQDQRKKRNVKNSPNKRKGINIPRRIIVALIAAAISMVGTPVISEAIDNHNEAKENRFEEALAAVKEKIAESVGTTVQNVKVYDKSSITSSISEIEEYIVQIGARTYRYRVSYIEGDPCKIIDEIKNQNIIEAIKILSNAQNGNYWESKDAEELAEKIENGEIDLSMKEAVEARMEEESERY